MDGGLSVRNTGEGMWRLRATALPLYPYAPGPHRGPKFHRYDGGVATTAKEDLPPMPSRPSVSVCMAAYNGAEHIQEQLDSILAELGPGDEVIIVDDGSTDGTREILTSLDDPRVRVVFNEKNLGYVRNFEKALNLSTGDVIMLSDQDDIWIPGRVDALIAGLDHADAAVGNCEHFGGTPGFFQRLRVEPRFSTRHARNLLGILVGYRLHWGSAMAVTRRLLDDALPFPAVMTESHDQWLAMLANVRKSITYLAADTVRHRLHDDNLTPKKPRSVGKVLRARGQFIAELAIAIARTRAKSRNVSTTRSDRDLDTRVDDGH